MTTSNNCLFCPKPEKKTKWYAETDTAILLEKLGGGPIVVLKRHTTEPTDEEIQHCHDLAQDEFGEHSFTVLMNHVRSHWHAHVRPE